MKKICCKFITNPRSSITFLDSFLPRSHFGDPCAMLTHHSVNHLTCSPHDRIYISTSFYSVFLNLFFFCLCLQNPAPIMLYINPICQVLPMFIELKKYSLGLPMVSLMSFWFIHPNFFWVQNHLQPNGSIR